MSLGAPRCRAAKPRAGSPTAPPRAACRRPSLVRAVGRAARSRSRTTAPRSGSPRRAAATNTATEVRATMHPGVRNPSSASTRHTPILRSASLRSSCCCWKGKVAKSWRSFSVRIMAGQRAWSSGGGQVQRRGVAGHIRSRERTAGGLALPSAPPSESGGKPVSARLAAQLVRAEKAGQIVQLKFTATSFVREARRLPSPC